MVLPSVLLHFAITANIGCELMAHLTLKLVPFLPPRKNGIAYGIHMLAFF